MNQQYVRWAQIVHGNPWGKTPFTHPWIGIFGWYANQSQGKTTWKTPLLLMKKMHLQNKKKPGNFRDFLGWRLHFTKNLPWNPTSIGPSLAPFKVKFPLNSNDVPLSFSGQRAENGGIITSHPPRKGITSPTSYLFDAYWMLVRLVVKASGKTWEMLWCSPKLNNWWAGSSYFFYQPYTVYLFERYVLYCAHIFSARLENLSRACSFKLKKCKTSIWPLSSTW